MKKFSSLVLCAMTTACSNSTNMKAQKTTRDFNYCSFYERFNGEIRNLLEFTKTYRKLAVVAHRGGNEPGLPENSLVSIKRATQRIPVIVEMDIVSSADGVDYLHHDKSLDRTTTGTGFSNSLNWDQIKNLHLRNGSLEVTKYRPISFVEILHKLRGKAFLMLDLKAPSSTADIVKKVKAADMLKSTIFIAYNITQAKQILQTNKEALVAVGTDTFEKLNVAVHGGEFVILAGDVGQQRAYLKDMSDQGHYVLGASYLGSDPEELRFDSDESIHEIDTAPNNGFTLLVSNKPFNAYRYLLEKKLTVTYAPE